MERRFHFWSAIAGGLVAALVVAALPAIAQVAEPNAAPGSNMKLGQTNIVNADTTLRGNSSSNLEVRNTGNGVPLNLRTGGNGEAPMTVDSRRLIKNLNADRLDFRHANELGRAAYASINDAPDINGSLVQATINVPAPGILLISGSLAVFAPSVDNIWCRLLISHPTGAQTLDSYRDLTVGAGSNAPCATNAATIASVAGVYTVNLDVGERNTATFRNASVWVNWVPFDGNGNVPGSFDNPTNEPARTQTDTP